jgi:hypothetical protein
MRYRNILWQRKFLAAALTLLCAALAGLGVWRVTGKVSPPVAKYTAEEGKKDRQNRARRGIGGSVRFAHEADAPGQADDSVESLAAFIYERSNVKMTEDSKKRLAKAERDVLKGKGHRLSVDELTDAITDITVEQLATVSDGAVEWAADIYDKTPDGEIRMRESGKWGTLTKQEFSDQVKAGRDWSRNGDVAVKAALRPLVAEEVNDRIAALSEDLPEQFGNTQAAGMTPTQAVVVAYSVAADDPLLGSREDLAKEKVLRRMLDKQTRAAKKAQQRPESGSPYGANGFLHSSPVTLLFNRVTVDKLVSRTEGGKK